MNKTNTTENKSSRRNNMSLVPDTGCEPKRSNSFKALASSVSETGSREAMKVSRVSIYVNIALSAFKLAAGIIACSGAMISDAVHSASDVFSTCIVMLGIKISAKKADKDHPYGHERMECVASILLAYVLALAGICIGKNGVENIFGFFNGDVSAESIPGVLALVAAVVSIAVKEWMYHYTMSASIRTGYTSLKADAWHHRSDALSSIGALAGILGARCGFPVMDSAASVVICAFILKASFDIFKDSVNKLVDRACTPETGESLCSFVLSQDGVRGIDRIATREFSNKIYVDMDIRADASLTLIEADRIADHVHDMVESEFPDVKHIMIHTDPDIHDNGDDHDFHSEGCE